jgi:hypothetical protein
VSRHYEIGLTDKMRRLGVELLLYLAIVLFKQVLLLATLQIGGFREALERGCRWPLATPSFLLQTPRQLQIEPKA